MLTVLLNWCYILFTASCLGYGISRLTERYLSCRIRGLDSVLMAGLIAATVYAQFFSIFCKVGLAANLVLAGGCGMILLLCRKTLLRDLKAWAADCGKIRFLVAAGLFLLWGYFTSRGYIHYDSDLYHAQSIRWIEEYGVVKGLGNLHERFAYNSASFALSALYSMKFLLGKSLHTLSGFFAFLLSLTAMDVTAAWRRKKLLLSDYARIAAIYYLTTIWDEVVSPASDYSIMCMIFFIVIKWLGELERQRETKEENCAPYALLCVAGVYAVTLKLTAGLILLLLIKPAYLLLRDRRFKEIGIYLGTGLLVAAPWVIRTVLISGWLVYPFPALDLFSFDWKMSAEVAQVDAAQIKTWARGLYDAAKIGVPFSEWFPAWFLRELTGTEKLLIGADLAGCVFTAVCALAALVRRMVSHEKQPRKDELLVLGTLCCSYLFWQLSAPMVRYGYAYILLVAALGVGYAAQSRLRRDGLLRCLILLYGIYKLGMMGLYVKDTCTDDRYLWQTDYGTYELGSYEVGGITFYYPMQGDRTGYEPFPAAPAQGRFELRGDDLSDGFRSGR